MVTRKIIVSLPEKEIILKNQFASIEQNKGNFININQDIKNFSIMRNMKKLPWHYLKKFH